MKYYEVDSAQALATLQALAMVANAADSGMGKP
ncbi:MAG: hypothetical protein ACI96M_002029, partial [Candidatus Azotimanducaceae bacterium]